MRVSESTKHRVTQLLEDLTRLLSRHGGVGLGVGVLGSDVLAHLNIAREAVKKASTTYRKKRREVR